MHIAEVYPMQNLAKCKAATIGQPFATLTKTSGTAKHHSLKAPKFTRWQIEKTDGVKYKNDCQRCDRQKTRVAGFHCLRPLSLILTVRPNSV